MRKPTTIRLLIISNSPAQNWLARLAKKLPLTDVLIVTAQNGKGAIAPGVAHQPDVAFVDLSLSETRLFATIKALRANCPKTRFVVVVSAPTTAIIKQSLSAGAQGVLGNDASLHELADCIRSVYEGRSYIPSKQRPATRPNETGLTVRELEVLRLIAADMRNKDIAVMLSISEGTVKAHVHSILSKFGANSRTGAIIMGHNKNLL